MFEIIVEEVFLLFEAMAYNMELKIVSPLRELVDPEKDVILLPMNIKHIISSLNYDINHSLNENYNNRFHMNAMRHNLRCTNFYGYTTYYPHIPANNTSRRDFAKLSQDISFVRNLWNDASQQYDQHHAV